MIARDTSAQHSAHIAASHHLRMNQNCRKELHQMTEQLKNTFRHQAGENISLLI